MHKIFKFLIIILALLFVLYYKLDITNIIGGLTMPEDALFLSIELDKNTYNIGDKIKIKYTISNNSNSDMYFINWDHGYVTEWICVLDENLNELEKIPLAIYRMKPTLDKDLYTPIKSGEVFTTEMTGIIKRGSFNKYGRIPYEGLAIDFENSAIMTKGPGIYYIEGRYSVSAKDVDNGKKEYGFENIWAGRLKSKRIKILIKGKIKGSHLNNQQISSISNSRQFTQFALSHTLLKGLHLGSASIR